ncbi:MAG: tRNA pseudouridine(55) synthase TruB [Rhodobiaceae bacterium]|nr:tRNA pseudouridine(55) synthase TruB [Rhodobiaceae bacterium]
MNRPEKRAIDGWLVLDKPVGLTSTRALGICKRLFRPKKAGHAGTLDPLASGILPLAFGEATKTVSFAMDGEKVYRFTVHWGIETETDDAEGDAVATSDHRPDEAAIRAALSRFTGTIMQRPPAYSAIKVDGERAYDLARAGEAVELAERPVEIDGLDLIDMPDADHAVFGTVCGKGTYVRALARDIARHLGTRGHVSALRRTAVGPFDEADSISLEKLEELGHKAPAPVDPAPFLLPVETVLDDIPALAFDRQEAARLRNGQPVLVKGSEAPIVSGAAYATERGRIVAIGSVEKGAFKPARVFNFGG